MVNDKSVNEQLRIAIVCDWLIGGGAERVVEQLHRRFPNAPIYTSYSTEQWRKKLDGKVVTGYLQHWPFPKLRKFIPILRGWWFSGLDLSRYDLVISSSGAEAKFIKTKTRDSGLGTRDSNMKPPLHISYIHAPTHYYWSRYNEYLKHPGFGFFDPLARLGLKFLVGPMRRWDWRAAQRPDRLIANSNFTKGEIKKYYGRDSVVIHPPVDLQKFKLLNKLSNQRRGFVTAGRQTPYKRFDLAVAACTKLNLPLTVIGNGPAHKKLVKKAGSDVIFQADTSDEALAESFSKAEGFIFPGIDDFGIVAVEAMAAGTPVIAYKAGGALDYVVSGQTGLFFQKQTVSALCEALQKFQKSDAFDSPTISNAAEAFSSEKFQKNLSGFLKNVK